MTIAEKTYTIRLDPLKHAYALVFDALSQTAKPSAKPNNPAKILRNLANKTKLKDPATLRDLFVRANALYTILRDRNVRTAMAYKITGDIVPDHAFHAAMTATVTEHNPKPGHYYWTFDKPTFLAMLKSPPPLPPPFDVEQLEIAYGVLTEAATDDLDKLETPGGAIPVLERIQALTGIEDRTSIVELFGRAHALLNSLLDKRMAFLLDLREGVDIPRHIFEAAMSTPIEEIIIDKHVSNKLNESVFLAKLRAKLT